MGTEKSEKGNRMPSHEKINNLGVRPGLIQTRLYSHRRLEAEISDLRGRRIVLSV